MAGDCEVNDLLAVVPCQELKMSMPQILKVQHKWKVKPKVKEPKENQKGR